MTLEQINAEIKEALRVSTDYDPYAEGYQDALFWFSDMLDTLEPSWHPYPREKPTEDGYYETTTPKGKVKQDWWNGSEFEELDEQPIAWKELDKPYKKEE